MRLQTPIRDLPAALTLAAFLLVVLAVVPSLAMSPGGQGGDFSNLPLCSGLPAISAGIADIERDLNAARDLYHRETMQDRTCSPRDGGSVCDQVTSYLLDAEARATQIASDAIGTDNQGDCWRCNPDELLAWASAIHHFGLDLQSRGGSEWSPAGNESLHVNLSEAVNQSRRACSAHSPARNAWVLEDIRINPGNHDLQAVRRFGNGAEQTHTCSLSDKNLGVSDETRRPDGSSYGYRYQFVFDRPPERIFPGESYEIDVRGSGRRFPDPGTRYMGQLYFTSNTLSIQTFVGRRTPSRLPFVVPEPKGDMTGQVVISALASTSETELELMASLGNEPACRVEYIYRREY